LGNKLFSKLAQELLEAYSILVGVIKKYFRNLRTAKFFVPENEVSYEMKRVLEEISK
jgi:hypothetical protein